MTRRAHQLFDPHPPVHLTVLSDGTITDKTQLASVIMCSIVGCEDYCLHGRRYCKTHRDLAVAIETLARTLGDQR